MMKRGALFSLHVVNAPFRFQKIFLLIFIFGMLCAQNVEAQRVIPFTGNSDTFVAELDSFFESLTSNKDKDLAKPHLDVFKRNWNNTLSVAERQRIAGIALAAWQMKLKTHHQYLILLKSVNHLKTKTNQDENLHSWLSHYEQLLAHNRNDELEAMLQATNDWIEMRKIGGKGTVSWYYRGNDWHFEWNGTSLGLLLNGAIVGSSRKDSTVIEQTTGTLLFGQNRWTGQSGKLRWQRFAGMDEVAASLSTYNIDLVGSGFVADSAVLRYPDYFPFAVLGRLHEQVFNSPPGEKTSFPRFTSYLSDYEVDGLFPNVLYRGAIILEGATFAGSGDQYNPAVVTFLRDGKIQLRVRASNFIFTRDRIQSEKAAVSIYLGTDSISHPGLWFRFDQARNQLNFFRSLKGIPDGPFFDNYHDINIFAEACIWNTAEPFMQFKNAPGLQTRSEAWAESSDYFTQKDYDQLQGIDAENPVAAIARYRKEHGIEREMNLLFLSEYLRKPPEQVAAQLLRLASKGYLIYDSKSEKAIIGEHFDAVTQAPFGLRDYDVIRFESVTEMNTPNFILNLQNNDLTLNGISSITLSESQGVELFPDNEKIVLKKDRDFVFAGLVKAGLFEFYSQTANFEYNAFKLNFSKIDSLAIKVPEQTKQSSVEKPRYVYLRNVLADLTGTLRIDETFNKSGVKNLPRFPVFTSNSESYVYYDDKSIQQGALKRDTFYYVIDPFEIDSLDNFSTDNLRFEGYLASGGIFPAFREPLVVMPDYSLGFEHHVPTNGYPMFSGLATYYTQLRLSNDGFQGMGRLHYLTSDAFSKHFLFAPEQVTAPLELHEMQRQDAPVGFPVGTGKSLAMDWQIDSNYMMLQTDSSHYELFGLTKFAGLMKLSPDGMTASGSLKFDDVTVDSRFFSMSGDAFIADTADFRLLAANTNRVAFQANDYLTHIDFGSRTGVFNHINAASRLSFPFNQYDCSLDEAFWNMDQQTVVLNNNKISKQYEFNQLTFKDLIRINLSGSGFTSTHPAQDSLSFFCLRANYDLANYQILAKDVKIIRVGDAAVFPSDSIVTIAKDAEMQPLAKAVIIADTSEMTHTFTDASVRILSRKKMIASGLYDYLDVNNQISNIHFSNISNDENGKTIAQGSIAASQNFQLNPWFKFAGDVSLESGNKLLRFKGGYQIVHQCTEDLLPFVAFDTLIDPQDVRLPVAQKNADTAGMPVRNGFYFAPFSDSYYAAFLQSPRSASDQLLAPAAGLVSFNKNTLSYVIDPANGARGPHLLELSTHRCVVEGRAAIPLNLKLTMFEVKAHGSYIYKMIPDSMYLDVLLSMNFLLDDKLTEMMADSLNNSRLPASDGFEKFYLPAVRDQLSDGDFEKLTNEISLYGAPRKVPEVINKTLVFSHLTLKWNQATRSFVSAGALHLANIGKTQVNKAINGFLEIEQSRSGDAVNLYLMPDSKSWYFFSFKNGVLQTLSSNNMYNTALMEVKDDKRIVNKPEEGGRYEFTISTKRKMVDFLRKMQNQGL